MKKILLVMLSLLAATSLFAQQAEGEKPKTAIDPFVTLRLWTGYDHKSEEMTAGTEGDTDLSFKKPAFIVFGFDAEYDGVKGKLEIGTPKPGADNNDLYLRHAFLTWNMAGAEILLGQTGTPYTVVSGQLSSGDYMNLGFGAAFDARLPQIKVTYMGAYLALIQPSRTASGLGTLADEYVDALLPKTALGYSYKGKTGDISYNFGLGGAVNMIQVDKDAGAVNAKAEALDGKKLVSYLGYLNGGVSTGGMFARFNATYGQNTGNFGITHKGGLISAPELADKVVLGADGKIKNTVVLEGFVELGYNVGIAAISGSVGYIQSDNDTFQQKDKAIAYAGQCSIKAAENFSIIPAVLYRDHMESNAKVKQGTDLYAGVSFVASYR